VGAVAPDLGLVKVRAIRGGAPQACHRHRRLDVYRRPDAMSGDLQDITPEGEKKRKRGDPIPRPTATELEMKRKEFLITVSSTSKDNARKHL